MTSTSPPQPSLSLTIEQTLHQAIAHHQSGQIQEAEMLYRALLQIQPNHPVVNHNMGVLAVETQQLAAALPHFMAALEADPTHGPYWLSYIEALIQAGQLDASREVLAIAKQQGLQGDEVEALAASLSNALQAAGQENAEIKQDLKDASTATSQNGIKNPKSQPAKLGKSSAHKSKNPGPQEMNTLLTLFNKSRYAEAVILAQTMTVRYPAHGFGWKVLGTVYKQMGRNIDALAPMQKAAALSPNDADAHSNLGFILKDLGRLSEAETSCRRALQIKPDFVAALHNLGFILQGLERLDEAEACYQRVLQLQPNDAESHNNLGVTLKQSGRLNEAEASYRRALAINPNYADAHSNLGIMLQDMGRLDDAETCYRHALQINPNYAAAHGNMLFCLSHHIGMEAQALFAEHVRFGEQFEAPLRGNWPQHSNQRNPDRCLQIGIVSGDLRNHAVAYFIEPLLAHLSGYAQLSLHAYANHELDDSTSLRLRGYFAHWHAIVGLPDAELAEKISADGIDILIDLSGHTAKNRLLTFARKPAPLQASWLGYPGTTGLGAMDYYLADRFYLPPGQFDSQFTEKIVQMPANIPFLPSADAPPVNTLPALGNGYVTFGSFNRPTKMSRAVISLWAQILRALPTSKMVLGAMPEEGQYDTLLSWFDEEGIARDRLSFQPRSNMAHYLGLHQQVDFCLDTFPYNGGTTTLHALWMGVPTLTLAGSTAAGRPGACMLGHAGLEAFVADDETDFVRKSLSWAGNLDALSEIRSGLRERFLKSAMGQPAVVAAGVEHALRIMWQHWCAGLQAESFEISLHNNNGAKQEAGA